jgi:microsomal dipeptidase-like Zn-dependent dipeptidase
VNLAFFIEASHMKKILIALVALFLMAAGAFFFIVPAEVGKRMNETLAAPPYEASERARALHQKLLVADLHADSLMWDRDLLEKGSWGHVDVPRLIEGHVAVQAFTVVTKAPRGLNIESNDDRTDNITPLVIASRWPAATWNSLKERALYQASRLHDLAARSGGKLVIIKTATDLDRYLERRQQEPAITAGFLGIEGAHALDGDLKNLDALFGAGFRMMAPTHFFDNQLGGSVHGVKKGGLTEMGREMIRRMEAKRMLVDVAHASHQVIDEVLAIATRPVLVSHTGVKGTCDNNRNLSDEHVRMIAKTGGVIGIGYWETAVCGRDAQAVARAIRHVVKLAGVDCVALGSDYDGAITAPFDTTGLVKITEALIADGFTASEIEKIMGGNVLRVLRANLP